MNLHGSKRFSDDEWFLLVSLPSLIGAAVSGAAKSGVIGTVKEAMANAKSVLAAREEYPENSLIQSLMITVDDRDEAKATMDQFKQMAQSKIEQRGVKTNEQLIDMMLEDCQKTAELLDERCGADESREYKSWVIQCGDNVAQAAKEGSFLGFGGERVSPAETAMLDRIKSALRA